MNKTKKHIVTNRYWWLMLLIGILSIICGIWVFRNPVESYFAMAAYFSFMFIIYGTGEIFNAFARRHSHTWGWNLVVGLLDLVIGFMLLGNLAWTADMLPFFVGFMLMCTSINFIGQALQMQVCHIRNWGWLLTAGILTLVFSFLLIFHPLLGLLNIVVWTGLAFIFGGVSAIAYSFTMRENE